MDGHTASRLPAGGHAPDAAAHFLRPRRAGRRGTLSLPPLLLCLAVLEAAALCFWPMDAFTVKGPEGVVFSAPAGLGQEYRTRYIHSVQLTPVIDVYRILQGQIRQRQEWTRSHNAGLPSVAPQNGRFVSSPPWMVMEGGGAWRQLNLRVGDKDVGRNEFAYGRGAWIPLYRDHAGQRLEFSVTRMTLLEICRKYGSSVITR
ncbi:MAG: DUF1850 domain-containing protein [Desulfovibrio sp.]|nr:DUF1850 domain-containing protein [Desulfovibrio sp.]